MVSSNQDAVPERAVSNTAQNPHRLFGADHPALDRPLQRRADINRIRDEAKRGIEESWRK